jgi:hypothetical protein
MKGRAGGNNVVEDDDRFVPHCIRQTDRKRSTQAFQSFCARVADLVSGFANLCQCVGTDGNGLKLRGHKFALIPSALSSLFI